MKRRLRWLWVALAASAGASILIAVVRLLPHGARTTLHPVQHRTVPVAQTPLACEDLTARLLRTPSEVPARLTCAQARLVALQVQESLVQPPRQVHPRAFSMSVSDWLDPHGLWSAAPDAPFADAIKSEAPHLLASLEHPNTSDGCLTAHTLGHVLASWVAELRTVFDRGAADAATSPASPESAWSAAIDPAFEDGPVTHPARQLAEELGRRSATASQRLGPQGPAVLQAFRRRLFPELPDDAWADVVLAAALRAYVLHVDPHGAWAPLDEETSLYEVELEATGRSRMWTQMNRTVAGVRLDGPPVSPLQTGDLIVAIGGILTAGLSVEQVEQLGILDPEDPTPQREVRVMRPNEPNLLVLHVAPSPPAVKPETSEPSVTSERVPYRDGEVLVLAIADVPDDLGDDVADAIAQARQPVDPVGVMIDLRGNGGGSIDGAKAALSLFLPGAPLFPMLRRDRSVELETAPTPDVAKQWIGPVGVIVDGNTASAAEMIAGALQVYGRGVLFGSRTFGKGCAQEYLDDQAGVGVLRLTTLLYALPDGSPVQRVGLLPQFVLDPSRPAEREDALENTFSTWRGPDVRRHASGMSAPWPSHNGHLGPCKDAAMCQALRLVGAGRSATARSQKP